MAGGGKVSAAEVVPDKFISRINELVEMALTTRVPGEAFSRAGPEITRRFDDLVGDLLENYQGPVNRELLRELLERPVQAETISGAMADQATQALLPVAIVRYLIGTCGLSFIYAQAPQFGRFVDRYGTDILSIGVSRRDTVFA